MERIKLNIQRFADNEITVQLTAAVADLEKGISKVKKSLQGLQNDVKKTADETDKFVDKLKKIDSVATKLDSSFSGFTKGLLRTFNSARRFVTNFYDDFLSKSVDTSEELNLFNVVFNNTLVNGKKTFSELGKEATKFQNQLNEAFGTNKKETMRYQGLFQAMGESAGLDDTVAALMSENMTKLAYDLASLYNTTETKAAEALRAGVYAGQTKPLRNYGIDVTQTSFKPLMEELGLEKSVNELTQAEKEILRYITTLKQAGNAMGDFANTIESPANQLKVLKQQFYEMQVAIGNLFVGAFSRMLPYVNAIIMVIKEVAKAIASFFGISISDFNTGVASYADALEEYSDGLDGVGSSATGASNAIKALKRQVLGFDQINNLTSPTPTGGSGGSAGGGGGIAGGIDKKLIDAIKGYENGMEQVRMKATEIRDKIMEWLGFTKNVDEETGEVYFTLNKGWTKIKEIAALIGGTLIFGAIIKILGKIVEIYDTFTKMKGILNTLGETKFFKTLSDGNVIKGLGYIAAIYVGVKSNVKTGKQSSNVSKKLVSGEAITNVDMFGKDAPNDFSKKELAKLKKWSFKDYFYNIMNAANWGATLAMPTSPQAYATIGPYAWNIGKSIKDNGLKETMSNINQSIAGTFGIDIYGQYLKPAWDGIVKFFTDIADWFVKLKDKVVDVWTTVKDWVVNVWTTIVDKAKEIIGPIVDWFNEHFVQPIIDYFKPLIDWFKTTWQVFSDTAKQVWDNVVGFVQGCVELVKLLWEAGKMWLDEHIIEPIKTSFNLMWNIVKEAASVAWDKIKEVWGIAKEWVGEHIVDPIKEKFEFVWGIIKTGAQKAWEGIKNVFSPVVEWFGTKFRQAWEGVKKVFEVGGKIFTGIKEGIENTFRTVVNGIIRGINTIITKPFNAINSVINKIKNIEILGQRPFEKKLSTISIPQIPTLANGGMVSAGQLFIAREAGPEMVGKIGNRTTVANNDQIIKGIEQGVYNAVTNAMSNGGLGAVQIDLHTDEGVIVDRINRITRQTGECPIEI